MCGIAGIWNIDSEEISDKALDAFVDSMAHRGPDGRGVYRDKRAGISLGHSRLAILDLSNTGHQPMYYADGRYVITFNGEIYNYLELKDQLRGLGHTFVGASDTEVILAAYAQWGAECQLRFNGMWAFGIWDAKKKELFVSRDRFGVKPVHYYYDGKRFAFASELKAFLALEWFNPDYNASVIGRAIVNYFEVEGAEDTLLAGVKRLNGGHSLTLNKGRCPVIKRWWSTLDHLEQVPGGIKRQSEKFRELFYDSCKIRMRSDVPLGAALSGGLDSSSVLCAMTQIKASSHSHPIQHALKAYVAFDTGSILDERKYSDEVLAKTGWPASMVEMGPLEGIRHFNDILYSFEEIHDQYCSPWLLYRKMREGGHRVSIEGHGGDELLAGYHTYTQTAMRYSLWPVPNPVRFYRMKAILEGMGWNESGLEHSTFGGEFAKTLGEKTMPVFHNIRNMFRRRAPKWDHIRRVVIYGSGQGGLDALKLASDRKWEVACFVDSDDKKWGKTLENHEIKSPDILKSEDFDIIIIASAPGGEAISLLLEEMGFRPGKGYLLLRDLQAQHANQAKRSAGAHGHDNGSHPWLYKAPTPFHSAPALQDKSALGSLDPLNRLMYTDFHFTVLPTILRNIDRISMAHGVEVRSPFMDWRLVCYAFSLPSDSKLGGGFTKRTLREAMRGALPESIRTRTTKVGFGTPLLKWIQALEPMILDTVNSHDFINSDIWKGQAIRDEVERACKNGEYQVVQRFWGYLQAYWLMRLFKRGK